MDKNDKRYGRPIKVKFEGGDELTTNINGSKAEVDAYYIGNYFNLGDGRGGDRLMKAVKVYYLDDLMTREQAILLVNKVQDKIGIGYHPDTALEDYVDENGVMVFTFDEIAFLDNDFSAALDVLEEEVYEIGLERQRAMLNNITPKGN